MIWWKTRFGRCIHQTPTGARVYENKHYRWLMFNSAALQTLIHRQYPERIALHYLHPLILALQASPGNACLLGLGGGGLLHAIAPTLQNHHIVAIDNDTEIIEIASTYFMNPRSPTVTIIQQEASLFVATCQTSFQHVLIDLFDAHRFPMTCKTPLFFSNCRALLKPNGFLALNSANPQDHWQLLTLIREHVSRHTVSFPIKKTTNHVILTTISDTIHPLLNLIQSTLPLKKLSWDPQWGCLAEPK